MKIILSPAKKMREHDDGFSWKQHPQFLKQSEQLRELLKDMSVEELAALMKCNHDIARLNYRRYQNMSAESALTPALFAYEGLAFQHMACSVFNERELEYVEKHLRILSGFYGLLRPFDGICLYRLEMQTKLQVKNHKNLYEFWGSRLADELYHENELVINLASKEYSDCITPYLNEHRKMITCVFACDIKGDLKEKGTEAKMLRGEMVRYMAVNQITDIQKMKEFAYMGYIYHEQGSDEENWLFIKNSR